MNDGSALTFFIIISFLILSLIVQGILGIIRREIRMKRIVWDMLFLPGTILMKIAFFIMKKTKMIHTYDDVERGKNAVISSICLILFAFLLITVFWYGAAVEYNIMSDRIASILVVVSPCAIIFLVPVGIVIHHIITNKNKK